MKLTLQPEHLFKNHKFPQWKHGDSLIQLGSCFSTNMTYWFQRAGFAVCDNPFGVVFHPISLADQLLLSLGKREAKPVVQKEGVFVSYDASGILYGHTESEIRAKIQEQSFLLCEALKKAEVLFVTFGSAHGYALNSASCIVSNCHQQPATSFDKKLVASSDMIAVWETVLTELQQINPRLKVVFTVSPVRYIRDGLVENNQSKAELIQLAAALSKHTNCFYFPAYELVIDILRDYRFFTNDLVHPNELAVSQVWEMCYTYCFDDATKKIIDEVFKLRQMEEHRLLYPDTTQAEAFRKNLHKKRESFLSQFPVVVWKL